MIWVSLTAAIDRLSREVLGVLHRHEQVRVIQGDEVLDAGLRSVLQLQWVDEATPASGPDRPPPGGRPPPDDGRGPIPAEVRAAIPGSVRRRMVDRSPRLELEGDISGPSTPRTTSNPSDSE